MLTPTHDMSHEDYHAHPAISRSSLQLISRSPRHFWGYQYGGYREKLPPSPALQLGTALHAAVLEPDYFDETYVEVPNLNKNTNAYKELIAEINAKGQLPISSADAEQIQGMLSALHEHETAAKALFGPGISEATFITNDPATDLAIKCRADRVTDSGWLIDLKTTQDASEQAFSKSCANFGYHVQAAYYMHAIHVATGTRPKGFLFVAVEKSAPYGAQVFRCSDQMLNAGDRIARNALLDIKQNLVTFGTDNPWPSYPTKIKTLDLPAWAQH